MRRFLCLVVFVLSFAASIAGGQARVYVTLWFDTEDYIEPASDDAALRLARDLTRLGVKATFKVVAEKARVLEARGRKDVIEALRQHDIGYHTQFHSIPPAPAVYLEEMGFLEGAVEFLRREAGGVADLRRIFLTDPSCYGQPGSSWGPQTNPALRQLGIRLYLDEGSQVGLNGRPFWYGDILHVFNMGPYSMRASLDRKEPVAQAFAEFDKAAAELLDQGGGVISIYYHPCEFVTTEFWDGVNFSRGANPPRVEWKRPQKRSPDDAERCYEVLHRLVEHIQANQQARFVTARELIDLYPAGRDGTNRPGRAEIAAHLAAGLTFLDTGDVTLSAADMLLILLGQQPVFVDGPLEAASSTYQDKTIPRELFSQAKNDVVAYLKHHRRLPSMVWLGSRYLSLADFAATLAASVRSSSDGEVVAVRQGRTEFEKYFASIPSDAFGWVIHPEAFSGERLLAMGRLQGWTLKPARLREAER
jgi:hypothetical protein